MSRYYGIVKGQAIGKATRRGSGRSGLVAIASSWDGCVSAEMWYDGELKRDRVRVVMDSWPMGRGTKVVLYEGLVGEAERRGVAKMDWAEVMAELHAKEEAEKIQDLGNRMRQKGW